MVFHRDGTLIIRIGKYFGSTRVNGIRNRSTRNSREERKP